MCHFAMGLTHCYKTTVFFTFIVNIALPCTVFFNYLTMSNVVTLKSGLKVTQGYSNI